MRLIRTTAILASMCALAALGAQAQTSGQAPAKKPATAAKAPAGKAPAAAEGSI